VTQPIHIQEPKVQFDATAEINNNPTQETPLSITVTINNNGDLIIQPTFQIKIEDSEGTVVETETVNEDEGKKITPLGTETYDFKIFTPELISDTKWNIDINVDQGDTYTTELTGIPDNDYTMRSLQMWAEEGLKEFATSNNTGFDNLFKEIPFNTSENYDVGLPLVIFSTETMNEINQSGDTTQGTTTDTTTDTTDEPDTDTETKQEKGLLESIIDTIINFFKGLFS